MSFLSETRAMIMNLKPAALSQHHLLSDLSSCSAFFGSLPRSSWPPCCSSNMLGMLLPWSFLTDWSLCIDCSAARYPQYRHSNLQVSINFAMQFTYSFWLRVVASNPNTPELPFFSLSYHFLYLALLNTGIIFVTH